MKSLWSSNVKFGERPSLNGNIETEIAVVGGGITGVLIAYMLKAEGRKVTLIEGDKICSGNIKNTTAKITIQHNLIYSKLIKELGKDKAIQYARANEEGIIAFRNLINENKIECDFEEKDAYLYTLKNPQPIIDEYKAISELGISGEIVTSCDLPLNIVMALKFTNQAQFHPLKFLKEISKNLTIFENTRVLDIKDNILITNKGEVRAEKIVIATHFPFLITPGYYFARMHQERGYIIALENAPQINGMYIDIDKSGYSFRNYEDLLLVGGSPKRTGKNDEGSGYDIVRNGGKLLFPKSREKYYWSSQDCMSMDGVPYIGQFSKSTPNIFVATGFNKWGMTTSMASAIIIRDLIVKGSSPYEEVFSPNRFDFTSSIQNIGVDGFEATKGLLSQIVHIPFEKLEDIPKGGGGIVVQNGEKVGVYKDQNGKAYFVKTRCPHLGCELKWNSEDSSWDCPCHGSRFDYKGRIIDGPTTKGISNE